MPFWRRLRDERRRRKSDASEGSLSSSDPRNDPGDLRAQLEQAHIEFEEPQTQLSEPPPETEAGKAQLLESHSATDLINPPTGISDEVPARPIQGLLAPPNGQHNQVHHSASTGALPRQGPYTEEYARTVAASADTINYDHVNLWIQYCEQHHGAKCSRRELDSLCTNEVDIILIDVRRKCLVRSTTASRYFAPSYVWGSVSQLQATTSNFESLTVHQALQHHSRAIPKVIKDAMEAMYSLGETYLWVDSLCILQDDVSVKHHQIANMAAIYSGAVLTIATVAARNANSSLPELWCKEPPLETGILSRLTLNSNDLDSGLSLLARAPGWVENIRKKEWNQAFAFYVEIIHEYSWKRLSYSYDVMNAFSGILSALEECFGWSFPHGLPEALFDYALMWVPADVVERRPHAPPGPNRHFPSWSWCG
ncbi:hypothetical protein W97_07704 [Coniosporium apollinis CBS 100218]|uniref:Heterokaryon incompatibility domain-containing protein n=1 Tax=Coniosporium apollinis (strain CBS 100218) TaxID=1168221 RepID=R7Z382_CONA1|nr:uncharacterized protein W97_07704 [Coniosporium apollinis CBS 100218]EON68494.1 hypothetical protein W97_07704 [Coniosporium apollinis CBS 100218]